MPTSHHASESSRLCLSLGAAWEEVDRACCEAKRFLEARHLEACCFQVLLGLREALNNAVEHGCGFHPEKGVSLELLHAQGRLILKVRDQGAGFAWSDRLYREPDVAAESGRGLIIMQRYFDSLRFNRRGNELVATLKLERAANSGGSDAERNQPR